jgi:hypothetical protein
MLHRIKLPDCQVQLREVLDFQERLLRFACTSPVDLSLEVLKQEFDEAGTWFWERLYFQGDKTALCRRLEDLLNYLEENPQANQRILDAFANDKDFQNHFDDESFRFHQRTLDEGTIQANDLDAAKPLMVSFYETLFESTGFPEATHPNTGVDKLTRSDWNEAFWKDNRQQLRVCPACDAQRPDRIRGRISSQVNHFFPKENYPFYSVHPDNLVPVCAACNMVAQGSRDPIDDHQDAPLINCFHPYCRPAIDYICVTGNATDVGKFQVNIHEKNGSISRRVQGLVNLLNLEERWADRMESLVNLIIESLASDTREEFQERLAEKSEDTRKHSGREPNSYVYHQLLNYILENPSELDDLWRVLERD